MQLPTWYDEWRLDSPDENCVCEKCGLKKHVDELADSIYIGNICNECESTRSGDLITNEDDEV